MTAREEVPSYVMTGACRDRDAVWRDGHRRLRRRLAQLLQQLLREH